MNCSLEVRKWQNQCFFFAFKVTLMEQSRISHSMSQKEEKYNISFVNFEKLNEALTPRFKSKSWIFFRDPIKIFFRNPKR